MRTILTSGTFNVQVNRELFVFGNESIQAIITKTMEPLSFVKVRNGSQIQQGRNELYFVVAVCDFDETQSLARAARHMSAITSPNVHRIVYIVEPTNAGSTELLYAAEIGATYVAFGAERDQEVRKYVKRITIQAEQLGSITHFENEITRLMRKQDFDGLTALDARLSEMDKGSEAVARLRAIVNFRLGKFSRFEHHLRNVLNINPQNLWAASELGKHYLRLRRPREGIAILEKLSRFHDLNVERHLALGNAYLNVGDHANAEKTFEKGQVLDPDDSRFEEGMAKVKILQGDTAGALELLHDSVFSEGVVSYLNMRGIMAIKTGEFDKGFALYKHALNHCPPEDLIKAKLHYNLGLGYVRNEQPEQAIAEFEHSIAFGGRKFARASSPLAITRKIVKNRKKHSKQGLLFSDFRFEDIEEAS